LDMLTLDTNDDKIPLCDVCMHELKLDERNIDTGKTSEKFTKFMRESKPIIDLLKLTDSIIIPETKLKFGLTQEEEALLEKGQGLQVSREKGASSQVFVEIEETQEKATSNSNYLDDYYAGLQVNLQADSESVSTPRDQSLTDIPNVEELQDTIKQPAIEPIIDSKEEDTDEDEEFVEA
jgi:hypothetical protein